MLTLIFAIWASEPPWAWRTTEKAGPDRVKPTNEIYSRHLLATRTQEESEALDQYQQVLRHLNTDYNFTAVTAIESDYILLGAFF